MRIAIAQMTSGIDPVANGDALVAAVAAASAGGAAMLFTPEMSNIIDADRSRSAPKLAREHDDLVLARLCGAAKSHNIWLHIGSMAFLSDNDNRSVNRSLVIDESGTIRARYDKLHLFDVDLATGESWRESAAYVPGQSAVAVETPVGCLGLTICYDIRFPALHQALSAAGVRVIGVPAAFTVPTGKAHWHVLLRARAIENACWVIAAAQTGQHADGRATFGHSLVVDPSGTIVLDMGETVGIGFADIDHERTDEARSRIPVIAHRRVIPPVTMLTTVAR